MEGRVSDKADVVDLALRPNEVSKVVDNATDGGLTQFNRIGDEVVGRDPRCGITSRRAVLQFANKQMRSKPRFCSTVNVAGNRLDPV